MGILIKNAGPLTTVQDCGIIGFRHQGIGIAGAADQRAYRYGNFLLDNNDNEAVLETTMLGAEIEFTEDNVIAVTGGNLTPKINGRNIRMYRAVEVKRGDLLSFGERQTGCRAYIAFAGGLDVPVLFGSRSTYMRSGFGGFEGRKLQKGDFIPFLKPQATLPNMFGRILEIEDYSAGEIKLRVVMGPQDDLVTDEGIRLFLETTYTVSTDMDRVGARLKGEPIKAINDGTIVSDGLSVGAIQIASNGQPIIMLCDCATTGGYNKIGTVISADIPLVAQAIPSVKIRFQVIPMKEAEDIYIEQLNLFSKHDPGSMEKIFSSDGWMVKHVINDANGCYYYAAT
jgi:biotin-dependent carboxylase-like uncharacterized protein